MVPSQQTAGAASFLGALVLASLVNVAVATAAIPISSRWNGRGGEEWSLVLILGVAALTGSAGIAALFLDGRKARGFGLLVAAFLAPCLDVFAFFFYYLVIEGQSLS